MKILIMYNPKSGNGKFVKKIPYIKKKLSKYEMFDYEFYASTGPNDITNHIANNIENKYDVVVISGGDGTLNEAINGIMKLANKPTIAYIPSGTTNDVGYMLGMKKNIKQTFKTILKQNIVKMDICKLNERYFAYSCGCGKFTSVSYSKSSPFRKKTLGKVHYFLEAAKEIIETQELNLKIKYDNQEISGKYFLMLGLSGNRVAGFSLRKKIPAKLNNGKLELVLFDQKNFTSLFNMTNYILIGDDYKNGLKWIKSNNIEITCDKEIDFCVDGESYGKTDKVVLSVEKEAIEIFVSDKSKKKFFE